MDPASIVGLVAACSSLTKQCASVVKTLYGLIETYKSAELTILSVVTECETIQFAWNRIELWAQGNLHHAADFEGLGARLQKSIYCGELVLSSLEEELLTITSKTSSLSRGVGLTWNNSVINEHQHRIRGQVAALQLLLQVMNLPRKADRIEVLSVREKVFLDSDESALSIIPSDRSTRYSLDGNRLSIISDNGDIQYIRFSFEDALFTSHVYKRNYRFPAKQLKSQNDAPPVLQTEDPGQSVSDEPETKTFNADLHNEADEEFFQDQMAKFLLDVFDGDSSLSNTDQTNSGVLRHDTLTTSISETTLAPMVYTVSLESDSKNDNNSSTSKTPNANPRYQQTSEFYRKKETLLSRALQKANTAVLLDNAQSFHEAIKAYGVSCMLLKQVMIRSSLEEDRRKLDAIRMTYHNRIIEIGEPIAPSSKSALTSVNDLDEGFREFDFGI
ncbi:hypothetical protein EK21DRAFT_111864 [Setomelanomma holmii]|uniref:MIT domain-containing protein n=1 Tax=Setomelanomma holmii TaxID=210430 RepID=A0A9P4H9Y1_9PLEO|nr:hypothetical protein EK21DRAFT_111864 [Setomelanomma holmii]